MCGRFSLFVPPGVLSERFEVEVVEPIVPRYNIAPGDDVVVVRNDAPSAIDRLEWGLIPHWVDDPDDYPKPKNARAETLAEKASFRDAFDERRCLVLADGFYEWQGTRGTKQPYRIARRDGAPFAFAGLWETWDGNGATRLTTTIVTTDPNATVAPIHDRMPVVLAPDEERRWLDGGDRDELQRMLDPYPDDELVAYPVSRAVNDPSNDTPDVVEAVDVDTQSGLSEFG